MNNDSLIKKIEEYIEKNIPNRALHTRSVRDTALQIAESLNIDIAKEKIIYASLLHDAGRRYTLEQMHELLKENGYSYDERYGYALLHSKAGAIIAKKEFGIDDEDVLNAIRYHTTGRAGMSALEKIIYAADYLEPTRHIEEADVIRESIMHDFDKGFMDVVIDSVVFVFSKRQFIAKESIDLYNECVLKYSNKF